MSMTPEPHTPPRESTTLRTEPDAGIRFRKNLVRVMTMQVVSLILLWWLQQHYSA